MHSNYITEITISLKKTFRLQFILFGLTLEKGRKLPFSLVYVFEIIRLWLPWRKIM